mgnify:CR=1 FL=1
MEARSCMKKRANLIYGILKTDEPFEPYFEEKRTKTKGKRRNRSLKLKVVHRVCDHPIFPQKLRLPVYYLAKSTKYHLAHRTKNCAKRNCLLLRPGVKLRLWSPVDRFLPGFVPQTSGIPLTRPVPARNRSLTEGR